MYKNERKQQNFQTKSDGKTKSSRSQTITPKQNNAQCTNNKKKTYNKKRDRSFSFLSSLLFQLSFVIFKSITVSVYLNFYLNPFRYFVHQIAGEKWMFLLRFSTFSLVGNKVGKIFDQSHFFSWVRVPRLIYPFYWTKVRGDWPNVWYYYNSIEYLSK